MRRLKPGDDNVQKIILMPQSYEKHWQEIANRVYNGNFSEMVRDTLQDKWGVPNDTRASVAPESDTDG